jgi:HSP20 family protein
MDLHENPETKTVTATFELPGVKFEDVTVEVQGNHLTVSKNSRAAMQCRSVRIPQGTKASMPLAAEI